MPIQTEGRLEDQSGKEYQQQEWSIEVAESHDGSIQRPEVLMQLSKYDSYDCNE